MFEISFYYDEIAIVQHFDIFRHAHKLIDHRNEDQDIESDLHPTQQCE